MMNKFLKIIILGIVLNWSPTAAFGQDINASDVPVCLQESLQKWSNPIGSWGHLGTVKLDSVVIQVSEPLVFYYFNKPLSYLPWREDLVERFTSSLKACHTGDVEGYGVQVFSNGYTLQDLIPNVYRARIAVDTSRVARKGALNRYITQSGTEAYLKGLSGNHIALWHSHGWYYESKLDRWEWQRARLYGSVEDLSAMMYVLPYLVPMLENAGCNVFMPRERCFNSHEVIIDNDYVAAQSKVHLNKKLTYTTERGFVNKDTLFPGDNPFLMGSSLLFQDANGKVATFKADVPEAGDYAVYVAYKRNQGNSESVEYKVHHSGGVTSFWLNQSMGGDTWAYLGTFRFDASQQAVVEVQGAGQISIDAVRLGGGMGNVARRPADELMPNQWSLNNGKQQAADVEKVNPEQFEWKTSNRPRYMEAARYWLQYAGMPDTLVYSLNESKNDYNDDYQSRGEWVSYLMGQPNGPTKDRGTQGLGIPIDLAFAFHTDAGVTPNDSVIGTLGIYSSQRDSGFFPQGQSKLASRDLTDIIQTQIVDDICIKHNAEWTRRGMWDRQYSEAWRPNVPTMLLELLSHQNLADMRYGLDPHFRFDVSRAIYKGMLKYLANQEGRPYVVQPLPVSHMAITENRKGYRLSWLPVVDSLEASAVPTKYKVYRRIDNGGFDNGTLVQEPYYDLPKLPKGQVVSYKVTAINEGGESFPGEVLSVGLANKRAEKVLVVNAFDRISAPAFVQSETFAGVAGWDDMGVPDRFEYGYTGPQYDFDPQSPWLDDDSPGWGASYGTDETKKIKGNTFDNVIVHGQAILKAGYSFVSVSDEVFESEIYDALAYQAVDIILGEEKTTSSANGETVKYQIYTPALMAKVKELTSRGQHLFMSGAYVGSDIHLTKDTVAKDFAADVLRFKWRTNHAARNGSVYCTDYADAFLKGQLVFNTALQDAYYAVEAPDAIEPIGINAITAMRYKENNASAATLYNGQYKTVILGFPFETIMGEAERERLMKQILEFFYNKQ
ncbi:golvesin C-terminal-like domain-containing protein [Carboxylicivirga taeanensis]|uniref:golvesin C-terminal-like domain-containing protein n=1 Tax=Carboxylicivirga taeanensis TaxID=1416875 RepID=UPI003F6DD608